MSDVLEPGMKVECVNATAKHGHVDCGPTGLVLGAVYTVRGLCRNWHTDNLQGIYLVEMRAACKHHPDGEPCFAIERFRPLRSRPTSIEIFREIDEKVFGKPLVTSEEKRILEALKSQDRIHG